MMKKIILCMLLLATSVYSMPKRSSWSGDNVYLYSVLMVYDPQYPNFDKEPIVAVLKNRQGKYVLCKQVIDRKGLCKALHSLQRAYQSTYKIEVFPAMSCKFFQNQGERNYLFILQDCPQEEKVVLLRKQDVEFLSSDQYVDPKYKEIILAAFAYFEKYQNKIDCLFFDEYRARNGEIRCKFIKYWPGFGQW